MSEAQIVTLLSAALGVLGTLFLFFGTYGFEPLEGAPFGSPQVTAYNAKIKAKNKVRNIRQKIGLGLLCLSFAFQASAVFLAEPAKLGAKMAIENARSAMARGNSG